MSRSSSAHVGDGDGRGRRLAPSQARAIAVQAARTRGRAKKVQNQAFRRPDRQVRRTIGRQRLRNPTCGSEARRRVLLQGIPRKTRRQSGSVPSRHVSRSTQEGTQGTQVPPRVPARARTRRRPWLRRKHVGRCRVRELRRRELRLLGR